MSSSIAVTGSLSPVTSKSLQVLLVGCNGMLAQKVASVAPGGYEIIAVDLPDFDMTNRGKVLDYVENLKPDVIVNCAAFTNVDGCETEQSLAEQVNGVAVGYLAEAAKLVDADLVHISTDYVFDGTKTSPYVEEDSTNPQSAYGHSKLLGEKAIQESGLHKFFIIRTSWLYGPGGNNFVETIIRLSKDRTELGIVADQVGSPTYTGDLADAIFALLGNCCDRETVTKGPLRGERDDGYVTECSLPVTVNSSRVTSPYGLYHFSNDGQCSWYEFAIEIARVARLNGESLKVEKINPINTEDYPLPAKRPAFSTFSKEKYCQITGRSVPLWQDSLARYLENRAQGLNKQ